jgi:uncharacterized protein DUF87
VPGQRGSALKARADWVFPGENGAAVAQAITGPILDGTLPVGESPRHRIQLGWAVETCEPVSLPARDVNVLVHGDPLSGKSWLAGALVERLVSGRYAVCVLDPEGDYHVLARLPRVTWAEIRSDRALERLIAHVERDPAALASRPPGRLLPLGARHLRRPRARYAAQEDRSAGRRGEAPDLRQAIERLIALRYGPERVGT